MATFYRVQYRVCDARHDSHTHSPRCYGTDGRLGDGGPGAIGEFGLRTHEAWTLEGARVILRSLRSTVPDAPRMRIVRVRTSKPSAVLGALAWHSPPRVATAEESGQ